jgi:hypothetical protein
MDANILNKYLHVKALADKGTTEGERAAAASILAGMEGKYPGIREAAEKHARANASTDYGNAAPGANPFPGFPFADLFGGSLGGVKLTPEDVQRAFDALRDLFGESGSAGDGVDELHKIAERSEVNVKTSKKGEVSVYARMQPDDLEDAADLMDTPDHVAAFAAIVGARVADALRDALMEALFDDGDDEEDNDDN